ncbi:MAG: hypothetical protein HXM38_06045 [Isoptericola variabilis]|jgi:hypothetical protein|nr:hypothetical protein [Actinomyces sp.]MBF1253198.1 hypothetical protein [Isoptericola variabilis]
MDVLEQLIERAKSVGVSADLIGDNDCVFGYEASMSYHFWVDDGQYFFGSDERATTYSSNMWTASPVIASLALIDLVGSLYRMAASYRQINMEYGWRSFPTGWTIQRVTGNDYMRVTSDSQPEWSYETHTIERYLHIPSLTGYSVKTVLDMFFDPEAPPLGTLDRVHNCYARF